MVKNFARCYYPDPRCVKWLTICEPITPTNMPRTEAYSTLVTRAGPHKVSFLHIGEYPDQVADIVEKGWAAARKDCVHERPIYSPKSLAADEGPVSVSRMRDPRNPKGRCVPVTFVDCGDHARSGSNAG